MTEREQIVACQTCHFYQNANEFGGQCYRRPPFPSFQVAFDGSGASQFENLRPFVSPGEWCGDHLPAQGTQP